MHKVCLNKMPRILTCINQVSNIFKEPSKKAEVVSQILYGEQFSVQKSIGIFYKGYCIFDNYPGFVLKKNFKKTNTKKFEKFIDKLYSSNIAELKIIENFDIQESEDFEAFENEDTISILNRYIEEAEINLDKSIIQKMMQEIYQEACELV